MIYFDAFTFLRLLYLFLELQSVDPIELFGYIFDYIVPQVGFRIPIDFWAPFLDIQGLRLFLLPFKPLHGLIIQNLQCTLILWFWISGSCQLPHKVQVSVVSQPKLALSCFLYLTYHLRCQELAQFALYLAYLLFLAIQPLTEKIILLLLTIPEQIFDSLSLSSLLFAAPSPFAGRIIVRKWLDTFGVLFEYLVFFAIILELWVVDLVQSQADLLQVEKVKCVKQWIDVLRLV